MRGAGCWRNVPGREDKIRRTQGVGSPEELPRSVAGPQQAGSHTGSGLGREGDTVIEVQASPGPSSLHHTVDPGNWEMLSKYLSHKQSSMQTLCLGYECSKSPIQKRSPLSHIHNM